MADRGTLWSRGPCLLDLSSNQAGRSHAGDHPSTLHDAVRPHHAEGVMARQALLSDEDRRGLFEVPRHEAGLIRHYTLSADDIELSIGQHRVAMNRLGFAVPLCLLRSEEHT